MMFASVRRYRLESGSIDEMFRRSDTHLAENLQQMKGFVEYQVLDRGNGEVLTITTFRDLRGAEESAALAASFVSDLGDSFQITLLEAFVAEVSMSRAKADVLEPGRY